MNRLLQLGKRANDALTGRPIFQLSPETKAHRDRLFEAQPGYFSEQGGGKPPANSGGGGSGSAGAPKPGRMQSAAKGLPGAFVAGDLINAVRNQAAGRTDLGGIERDQLARQGIGGYLTNVAQNLVTPGNSLLSYFGANEKTPEALVGGGVTGPLIQAAGSNLASAIRFNRNPEARQSIWRGLDADATRHTQNRDQSRTQLADLQKQLAALTKHRDSLTRDPGAAFKSQFAKNLGPAVATAATSPLGSSLMATQEAPNTGGLLSRLGQLASFGAPLTSRLTGPATSALIGAH